eukprot:TRINITY_DN58644_c0_g1_i1.p1 TRINITY_DN58644_c0_g1~~TRINITY_DN58644_c0_g1_i1.p1  ORF type:complete len:108 (+),score=16.63 TRINITY_DN58644_c0_g1_i1:151-474(+)
MCIRDSPTFVTEKIVALAKESKTSRLRRAAARGGAEGLLLADEDAQIDFLSTSSHTQDAAGDIDLSLIHISEPTRLLSISYAVFCLKKKKTIAHMKYITDEHRRNIV